MTSHYHPVKDDLVCVYFNFKESQIKKKKKRMYFHNISLGKNVWDGQFECLTALTNSLRLLGKHSPLFFVVATWLSADILKASILGSLFKNSCGRQV